MNLEFKHLLPEDFSPQSRVWIYQSSRLFSLNEAFEIEDKIQAFCQTWLSHGADVKAYGNLFFGQFVILMTDETNVTVSGCSTDSSVRFIKELGQQYSVDFFERTNLAFVIKEKIQMLPLSQLSYAVENGFITGETLFFNNIVQTRHELETKWLLPVKDSWLSKKLPAKA
jgi:hypothetical protein